MRFEVRCDAMRCDEMRVLYDGGSQLYYESWQTQKINSFEIWGSIKINQYSLKSNLASRKNIN